MDEVQSDSYDEPDIKALKEQYMDCEDVKAYEHLVNMNLSDEEGVDNEVYQERIEDLQTRILGLEKARKDLTNQYAEA